MTICERVDAILAERGMSRRKLAIKAGIPPSSFQSAMARNKNLSLDMLFPISDVLGISVTDLAGEETPSIPDNILEEEANNLELEDNSPNVSGSFEEIINNYIGKLNELGKIKLLERAEELLEVPKYRREIDNG